MRSQLYTATVRVSLLFFSSNFNICDNQIVSLEEAFRVWLDYPSYVNIVYRKYFLNSLSVCESMRKQLLLMIRMHWKELKLHKTLQNTCKQTADGCEADSIE